MPRMDGTGPDGKGPISGVCRNARGANNSQNQNITADVVDDNAKSFGFRRAGRGMGRGFGRRRP